MAKIYYNLVKDGHWDINNIPPKWKNEVKSLLEADNTPE